MHDRQTPGASSAQTRHPLSYRADIDGLRAVAVLLVIVFHAFPNVLTGGYVGVDVFFVISGYLISGLIVRHLDEGRFSVIDFYNRRVRRIFPALIAILIASFVYGWFFLLPGEMMRLGKHIAGAAVFIPNFVLWSEVNYFDTAAATKPLLHLWSLGVEEQFYLLWPLALYLLHRRHARLKPVILMLAFLSFGWSVIMVYKEPAGAFYLPLPRFWELMIGAFLSQCKRNGMARTIPYSGPASFAGLAMIILSAIILRRDSLFPGFWALLPTVGTALIIAAGQSAPVNRVLACRPSVAIGLISYSLYLWHWPLLSFAYIATDGTSSAALRMALVSAAFLLASLTYVVEKPIRRQRNKHWQVATLLFLMVATGAIGFVTSRAGGFRSRYPAAIQSVLDYQHYNYGPDARLHTCWLLNEPKSPTYAPQCFLDPTTASTNGVVIWGDSHAGRLYPGLRKVLGRDANIAEFARSSCPPTLGLIIPVCSKSNKKLMSQIARQHPRTVILFAFWEAYDKNWLPDSPWTIGLQKTIAGLSSAGIKNIVLVGPSTQWITNLPKLVYQNWAKGPASAKIAARLSTGFNPQVNIVNRRLKKIAEKNSIAFFSLLDVLCNAAGCITHVPGKPQDLMTWDYGHLTTPGSAYVVRKMLERGLIPGYQ